MSYRLTAIVVVSFAATPQQQQVDGAGVSVNRDVMTGVQVPFTMREYQVVDLGVCEFLIEPIAIHKIPLSLWHGRAWARQAIYFVYTIQNLNKTGKASSSSIPSNALVFEK